MFLRFRLNAIVRFELMGFSEPQIFIGKVVSVESDEVEIIPQLKVYLDGTFIDLTTADTNCSIHLRRCLIANWRYARFDEFDDPYNFLCYHDISKSIMNEFNARTLICEGSGKSCGHIVEED